jgi:hypothetical protein
MGDVNLRVQKEEADGVSRFWPPSKNLDPKRDLHPMRGVIPATEQFQHFLEETRGGLWSDIYGKTRQYWNQALELESARLRDVYMRCDACERTDQHQDHRNGFHVRSSQTRLGELQLKIARTRKKNFLPPLIHLFQRRTGKLD